jgi:hypothetical protein
MLGPGWIPVGLETSAAHSCVAILNTRSAPRLSCGATKLVMSPGLVSASPFTRTLRLLKSAQSAQPQHPCICGFRMGNGTTEHETATMPWFTAVRVLYGSIQYGALV